MSTLILALRFCLTLSLLFYQFKLLSFFTKKINKKSNFAEISVGFEPQTPEKRLHENDSFFSFFQKKVKKIEF